MKHNKLNIPIHRAVVNASLLVQHTVVSITLNRIKSCNTTILYKSKKNEQQNIAYIF